MHKTLEVLLCQRYPKLFERWGVSSPCFLTDEKFACGDGWFDLIDTLCGNLQFRTDHAQAEQIRVTQIKNKLGTLRFYFLGSGDEYARGMQHMAIAVSALICEECGATHCQEHQASKLSQNI